MIPEIISIYFPQFHTIPENDIWWGKDFNDWQLVRNAKPNFENHHQPRVPVDEDYYNPCKVETLEKQILLAKKYGIGGFMFYHYWFDGKLMLEKPLEVLLENKQLDMPFCICWANETWTRAWIGKPESILQQQTHLPDSVLWEKHFEYLEQFFKDQRYICVNDKPVIIIYQPSLINGIKDMIDKWNEWSKQKGYKGLYIIGVINHEQINIDSYTSMDGILRFQPRQAYNSGEFSGTNLGARFQILRYLPYNIQNYLRKINMTFSKYHIFDSKKIWEVILKNAYKSNTLLGSKDIYESAFFEWDNTPRYGKKAKIFTGLTYEEMQQNLTELLRKAQKAQSKYVFFNAWNEWSESAYLEPDKKNGYKYLEIIRDSLKSIKNEK